MQHPEILTDAEGYLIRDPDVGRPQRLLCPPLAGPWPLRPAHMQDGAEPIALRRVRGGYHLFWSQPFSPGIVLWELDASGRRRAVSEVSGSAREKMLVDHPAKYALQRLAEGRIAAARELVPKGVDPATAELDLLYAARQIALAEGARDEAIALHYALAARIDQDSLPDAGRIRRYFILGTSYDPGTVPEGADEADRLKLFAAALHAMILRMCHSLYPQLRGVFRQPPRTAFLAPKAWPAPLQGRRFNPHFTFAFTFSTHAIEDLEFQFFTPLMRVTPRLGASVAYKYWLVSQFLTGGHHNGILPEAPPDSGQRRLSCVVQCGDHLEDIPGTIGYGTANDYAGVTAIPDVHFFMTNGYAALRRQLSENWLPWDERRPNAFWRGSTTGVMPDRTNYRAFPRYQLCTLSRKRPDLLDARITRVTATDPGDRAFIEAQYTKEGILGSPCPEWEFMRSKGIIVIDGHVNAWGLFGKLLTGSLVFLVGSRWRQWYYDDLRAWEHFIPVAEDLSDLEERLETCWKDDDLARRIAAQGRAFILGHGIETEMPKAARAVLEVALKHS